MSEKDNGGSTQCLPKGKLQDLCRKHGLSPYKTKPNLVASLVSCHKGVNGLLNQDITTDDIENSIRKLPKKELQDLCRKHGLSPCMTKSNLVNSLITYAKGAGMLSLEEMKTKDSRNSICTLPKKKLQDLCKKYGLCPYLTKPNLVNSLITYFKVNFGFEGSKYNFQDPLGLTSTIGEISSSRSIAQCDEKGFSGRGHNQKESFSKNAFTPDVKSIDLPSFKFSVSSEDGINLYVDLNSSPSNWYEKLEKKVHVCQHLPNENFQSFRQEIQYLGSSRGMTSLLLSETYSESKFNSSRAQTTESTDDASLGYLETVKSCDGSGEYFTCSEGKEGSPTSSGTVCGVQNAKITDVNTFMGQDKIPCLGLNTFQAPDKTGSNPESITNANHYKNSAPEKPIVLDHISSETDCTELKASEGGLKNLVDAAESLKSKFPNSYEDSCSIFSDDTLSSAEGGVRDRHVNITEAPKNVRELLKEHLLRGGKKRKRHDGKSANVFHYNDGRILRSAKRLQVLPRRSTRLISM